MRAFCTGIGELCLGEMSEVPWILATSYFYYVAGFVLLLIILFFITRFLGPPLRGIQLQLQESLARLKEQHFERCAESGKPRGLRWTNIEWAEKPEVLWDKQNRLWSALLGATIQFEAIEGGDMEGVEAVGNLRTATAIFFYDKGAWRTSGKMIFNMTPDEVIERFVEQYQRS